MDEVRLIDANMIRKYISNRQIQIAGILEKVDGWIELENVLNAIKEIPTIDPESLRPVAHWEDVPGSYKDHIGKDGSWFVPTTRCTNPECREINPCSLKTPFCPMCGCRMEDVPYDVD